MWDRSLGQEDPLEEGMATHSGISAWRTPRTEGPGGLQSMGSQESWIRLRRLSTLVRRQQTHLLCPRQLHRVNHPPGPSNRSRQDHVPGPPSPLGRPLITESACPAPPGPSAPALKLGSPSPSPSPSLNSHPTPVLSVADRDSPLPTSVLF